MRVEKRWLERVLNRSDESGRAKAGKVYTVLFIPAARERMKRFDISHRFMIALWGGGGVLLAFSIVFAGVALYLLRKEDRMVHLAQQSQSQKQEIVRIYGRMQEIRTRLLLLAHEEKKIRMILSSTPDSGSDTLLGEGGGEPPRLAPSVLIQKGPEGMSELMSEMDNQMFALRSGVSREESSLVSLRSDIRREQEKWAITPSIWPVHGILTSGFGWRNSPFGVGRDFHPGIDIAGPTGVPVVAPAGGTIEFAGWDQGYGKSIRILHGNGIETLFGHLDSVAVSPGERVVRGEVIGYLGNTGLSTGPHLHYEILKYNHPVNPTRYIIDY
ncbi:MAG: Putative peptidase, M23B family [Leptospirillum sp. Group II 'C75']|uniref:Peptidase M23 n=2 Tax=Leptospirillum ferriphilum TaxID=178606 RepID=A0A1V3SXH7_9BACT|nr:putative peptidase, M23B family [Leptospirillum ferriphilum ML-04]AKS23974.1 peptidase M23 [Leptospirillum sp. Group II 'CF-1']EAY56830.1 MAG: putative peptidase, M23B family [Leptospirillum rubarum]EIJ76751.1 MAG: Putative peptidase, M23B family [Leptospirillum sp. Group II 'C75']OOH74389.1 peptidase M23 [Leptospirillum ferriphilum]